MERVSTRPRVIAGIGDDAGSWAMGVDSRSESQASGYRWLKRSRPPFARHGGGIGYSLAVWRERRTWRPYGAHSDHKRCPVVFVMPPRTLRLCFAPGSSVLRLTAQIVGDLRDTTCDRICRTFSLAAEGALASGAVVQLPAHPPD